MRIFVTGATGFIGRAVIAELKKHNHDVIGLARTDASGAMLRAMKVTSLIGQGRDVQLLTDALEGVHAIVHLANTLPTDDTTTEDTWKFSGEVMVKMMENLLRSSERTGVKTVVFPSFYGIYGDYGDVFVTEEAPVLPVPSVQRFWEAEQLLLRSSFLRRSSGVILRLGLVYSHDSPDTRGLLYALKRGQASIEGDGAIYWPMIHVDDVAQAVRLALEQAPHGETYNICDNEPVLQSNLYMNLAQTIEGPIPESSDDAQLMPYMGRINLEPLSFSVRLTNAKARDELGFDPQHKNHRSGFEGIIEKWLEGQND
ncbi:MAG: NAD(P)-dependent oxidoreductase [Chloroflexi bacterium]|nr:NAD(P)-dependent oxidoreductase [Chloroflexota bacterium]